MGKHLCVSNRHPQHLRVRTTGGNSVGSKNKAKDQKKVIIMALDIRARFHSNDSNPDSSGCQQGTVLGGMGLGRGLHLHELRSISAFELETHHVQLS